MDKRSNKKTRGLDQTGKSCRNVNFAVLLKIKPKRKKHNNKTQVSTL